MKFKFIIAASLAISFAFFTSCEKEKETEETGTTASTTSGSTTSSSTTSSTTTSSTTEGSTTSSTTTGTTTTGSTTSGSTTSGSTTTSSTTSSTTGGTTGISLTEDGAEIQLETIGRSYKTQPTLNGLVLPQTYGSEKDDSNGEGNCGGCDQYTQISALRCMNLDSTSTHQSAAIEFNFPYKPATGSYKVIFGSSADKAHPAAGTVYVIATGYEGSKGTTYKGKSGTVELKVTGKVFELSFNKIGTADKDGVDNDVLSGQLRFTFP